MGRIWLGRAPIAAKFITYPPYQTPKPASDEIVEAILRKYLTEHQEFQQWLMAEAK